MEIRALYSQNVQVEEGDLIALRKVYKKEKVHGSEEEVEVLDRYDLLIKDPSRDLVHKTLLPAEYINLEEIIKVNSVGYFSRREGLQKLDWFEYEIGDELYFPEESLLMKKGL